MKLLLFLLFINFANAGNLYNINEEDFEYDIKQNEAIQV